MSDRESGQLLDPEQFTRLRDRLAAFSGVYLDTARYRILEQAVQRRIAQTGETLAGYERLIQAPAGQAEIQRLAELVLNHETMFFRNGPHMRALISTILPELHRRKPVNEPLRIWSAGCATGEEPYSLAIAVYEALGPVLPRPVEIWATDLSELALARARDGVYRGRAIANLSPEQLRRYFQPHGDGVVVGEALRSLVRFDVYNLLDPLPARARGIDIIFCQNVTIYFQIDTCRALMERFHMILPEGGLLFLGFSETLWNIFDGFQSQEIGGGYIYSKGAAPGRSGITPARGRPVYIPAQGAPASARSPARPGPVAATLPPPPPARAEGPELIVTRARALLDAGNPDAAIEVLRTLPPDSPVAPRAIALAARIHADRGELDIALAEARRAIAVDPLNDVAHLLLGVLTARLGQWHEAITFLERARYLDPGSPIVSFHLADAYHALGRSEPAAREYRNTLRKLEGMPRDRLLDGVAVSWLEESCRRRIQQVAESGPEKG